MDRDRDRLLEKIVQLSYRMHERARSGEWDALIGLENERQDLIGACFGSDERFDDAPLAARQIRRVLDLDREVKAIGLRARDETGRALGKLKQGRNATRAYRRCQR